MSLNDCTKSSREPPGVSVLGVCAYAVTPAGKLGLDTKPGVRLLINAPSPKEEAIRRSVLCTTVARTERGSTRCSGRSKVRTTDLAPRRALFTLSYPGKRQPDLDRPRDDPEPLIPRQRLLDQLRPRISSFRAACPDPMVTCGLSGSPLSSGTRSICLAFHGLRGPHVPGDDRARPGPEDHLPGPLFTRPGATPGDSTTV